MSRFFDFAFLSSHAGQTGDAHFGARAMPIFQTAFKVLPDTDTLSRTDAVDCATVAVLEPSFRAAKKRLS
jgi:O-acetylhomoserine/O-acetylserine sulfhydrylase-like pyridoxal-dependent enzyme